MEADPDRLTDHSGKRTNPRVMAGRVASRAGGRAAACGASWRGTECTYRPAIGVARIGLQGAALSQLFSFL
jgi:hypothetical protein